MSIHLRYCDAVEMQDRQERLVDLMTKLSELETGLVLGALADEERRERLLHIEMTKSEVAVASHYVQMGRAQLSGYGRLL